MIQRHRTLWIFAMALILWAFPNRSQGQIAYQRSALALTGGVLRVGFSEKSVSLLGPQDQQRAINVLFKQFAADHQLGYLARIYQDDALLASDVRQHQLDVFLVTGESFCRMRRESAVRPLLVPSAEDQGADVLLILTNRHRTLQAVANGKLTVATGGWGEAPLIWLEDELRKVGLPTQEKHFAKVERVASPMRAILRTFYKKCDACIVPRRIFNTARSENPQLEDLLHVAALSEPLMQQVLGVSEVLAESRPDIVEAIIQTARYSVRGAAFRQYVLGSEATLIPFEEKAARSTIALVAAADALAASSNQVGQVAIGPASSGDHTKPASTTPAAVTQSTTPAVKPRRSSRGGSGQ